MIDQQQTLGHILIKELAVVAYVAVIILMAYVVVRLIKWLINSNRKDSRFKYIAAIILVVFGSFYWVFVRPYAARKNCARKAYSYGYNKDYGSLNTEDYDLYYKICLQRNGL